MWILIVVTAAYLYGGTQYNKDHMVAFQEFNSQQKCASAAAQISYAGVKAFCVEK